MKIAQTVVLILSATTSLACVGLLLVQLVVATPSVKTVVDQLGDAIMDEGLSSLENEFSSGSSLGSANESSSDGVKRLASRMKVTWGIGFLFFVIGVIVDRYQNAVSTSIATAGLILMLIAGFGGFLVFGSTMVKLLFWVLNAALPIAALIVIASLQSKQQVVNLPVPVYPTMPATFAVTANTNSDQYPAPVTPNVASNPIAVANPADSSPQTPNPASANPPSMSAREQ